MDVSIPAGGLSSLLLPGRACSRCRASLVPVGVKVLLSPLWRSFFLFYGILARLSSGKGLGFGIDNVTPGQVAPGQAQHQHLGGGHIAGIGDIVLVA